MSEKRSRIVFVVTTILVAFSVIATLALLAGGSVEQAPAPPRPSWVDIGNYTTWTAITYKGQEYIVVRGYGDGGVAITPVLSEK